MDIKVEIKGSELQKIKKCACVLIPAKLSMGSSGPLLHYYNNSKFIIASNVGHLKEDVKNKKTGLLVKNENWLKAFLDFHHNKMEYLNKTNLFEKFLNFRTFSYTLNLHNKLIQLIKK